MITQTWLTRRPSLHAGTTVAVSLFFLFLSCGAYWWNFLNAASWMVATRLAVFEQHEIWRLWTSLFAHADLGHLLSNSLMFSVLGFFLSGYFGILMFPALAIFMGGLTNAIVISQYHDTVALVGMSGVVYWMGGAWLVLYLFLDQQKSLTQRLLRSFGVALGVFMPASAFDPQVSYGAHLVGFVLGVLSGVAFYYLNKRKLLEALVEVPEEDSELEPEPLYL